MDVSHETARLGMLFDAIPYAIGVFVILGLLLVKLRQLRRSGTVVEGLSPELAASVSELVAASNKMSEELTDEKRKSAEYLAIITTAQKERDTWRKLYETQAFEHSNAQGLLLRALEQVCVEYHDATGNHAAVPAMVAEVVRTFSERHHEAIQNMGKKRPPKKPLQTDGATKS